jgi:hypothetical protein
MPREMCFRWRHEVNDQLVDCFAESNFPARLFPELTLFTVDVPEQILSSTDFNDRHDSDCLVVTIPVHGGEIKKELIKNV